MEDNLVIYINDPSAPKPNRPLTPGACAVVVNKNNEVLLHKRADMENLWSLPGGVMKVGESISQCCIREIQEETELEVAIKKMIGIYSSPECIFAWSDDSVFQSFVVAFLCEISGDNFTKIILNDESDEYGWFSKEDVATLDTLPYVKEIIEKSFSETQEAFYD